MQGRGLQVDVQKSFCTSSVVSTWLMLAAIMPCPPLWQIYKHWLYCGAHWWLLQKHCPITYSLCKGLHNSLKWARCALTHNPPQQLFPVAHLMLISALSVSSHVPAILITWTTSSTANLYTVYIRQIYPASSISFFPKTAQSLEKKTRHDNQVTVSMFMYIP